MSNEKMKILKMLEDGKITADEAARLLEVSGRPESDIRKPNIYGKEPSQAQKPANTFSSNAAKNQNNPYQSAYTDTSSVPPAGSDYSQRSNNNGYGRPSATPGMESFADEVGRKFDSFVKDIEPALQKLTGIVVEKTVVAADKISKSLSTTTTSSYSRPTPRPPEHPKSYSAGGMGKGYEKNIELKVAPGNNELIISGQNAPLLLKGYNGDKISAKLMCVPKRANARIELSVLGSKYFLDYDEDDFEKVAIDAFIPENLFKNITISNFNGDLNLSTINAGYMNAYTSNGDIVLNGIYAENLKIECENGKEMRVSNIFADNALIENYNGSITANNIEVANLKMASFNGAFNMNILNFNKYDNYVWVIETSNQKLNLNLPTFSDVGYYLKAKTSLANVKVGLTGLNYIYNSPNMIEAKTIDFDILPKKVNISLETSNAPLVVN